MIGRSANGTTAGLQPQDQISNGGRNTNHREYDPAFKIWMTDKHRRDFVADKKTAYSHGLHPTNLVASAKVDEVAVSGEVAVAITSLTLLQTADAASASGSQIYNEVRMARRMGKWEVSGYLLHSPQA